MENCSMSFRYCFDRFPLIVASDFSGRRVQSGD
jgi:hypothetical protein